MTYSTNPKVIKGQKLLDTAIEKETSKVIEKRRLPFSDLQEQAGIYECPVAAQRNLYR